MSDPRALLDAYAAEYLDPEGECAHDCDDERSDAAPKAFAALRAVLDQHPMVAVYEDNELYCRLCNDAEGVMVPWPCPTVQVITAELERQR